MQPTHIDQPKFTSRAIAALRRVSAETAVASGHGPKRSDRSRFCHYAGLQSFDWKRPATPSWQSTLLEPPVITSGNVLCSQGLTHAGAAKQISR
jgi:hypothetical protein